MIETWPLIANRISHERYGCFKLLSASRTLRMHEGHQVRCNYRNMLIISVQHQTTVRATLIAPFVIEFHLPTESMNMQERQKLDLQQR